MKKKTGKRKSKSWRRRIPRCTMCTTWRWLGNAKERTRFSDRRRMEKNDKDEE